LASGTTAAPAKKRAPKARFEIPDGWITRGFSFEVAWPTDPVVRARVCSHFGARRFAYNWALAQVKADLDAKRLDPTHQPVPWNLYALRRRFNAEKPVVAPWWAENSKEAYSTGIADLCAALTNWKNSQSGARKGRKVGFPKYKSKRKDKARVRFTTGGIRVEPDRRTIILPVVGAFRSKENTRRLERLVATGKARILSATLSERWGRLFVSFSCLVAAHPYPAPTKGGRAGVDLGLRALATVVDDSGTLTEVPNPAPLRATLTERRRVGRQMSRRIPGSKGHRAAKAKLVRLDRRAVYLRRESAHQLTSWLADTYSEIVVEDLDLAAMKKSMGRRAFRRSVSDAALGQVRPQLTYKMAWRGRSLTVAGRWFASSQIHHGCGCHLIEPRKLAKQLVCATTGELVDRDTNAAKNLRDWPDYASCGPVGATAPKPSSPTGSGGGLGSDTGASGAGGGDVRPSQSQKAAPGEARTKPGDRRGTPRRGAA
jgi:putative transposase